MKINVTVAYITGSYTTTTLKLATCNSVEIPTRCSFVIEFIISRFIEGSTCFEQHTAHHQEL